MYSIIQSFWVSLIQGDVSIGRDVSIGTNWNNANIGRTVIGICV